MSVLHQTRGGQRLNTAWARLPVNGSETLLVQCNTPGKKGFDSKADAVRFAKTQSSPGDPYACQCGKIHIRSKGRRR